MGNYCRNCGHELHTVAKFCPACGTPVASAASVKTEDNQHIEQKSAAAESSKDRTEASTEAICDGSEKQASNNESIRKRYCKKCGHELPAGAEACPFCKTVLNNHNQKQSQKDDSTANVIEVQKQKSADANKSSDETKVVHIAKENTVPENKTRNTDHGQAKKKSSAAAILIIIVLLAAGTFAYLFIFNRDIFSGLFTSNSKDAAVSTANADLSATDAGTSTQETAVSEDIVASGFFEDAKIETAIRRYLNADAEQQLNEADLSKITSIEISNGSILINGGSVMYEGSGEETKIALSGLEKLPNLKAISITGASGVSFGNTSVGVMQIYISDSVLQDDLAGIENYPSLTTLSITDSTLNSLSNIAKSTSINTLSLIDVPVSDGTGMDKNTSIRKITIVGSSLYDYSVLRNIEDINMYNRNGTTPAIEDAGLIDKPTARCVFIKVNSLRSRSLTDTSDASTITGHVTQDRYYYILDSYVETSGNYYTWYKVGNDAWIASKEGEWTYTYE